MAMVSLQSCYDRAHQAMAQGDYDKAEAICQHILQYYSQDLGTFQLLGQIHLERKAAREARSHFRRVLEIDPENVSAHWGMGIAYHDEGNLEQAAAEFEQALEIKPDLSDLRGQLLRLYTELYGASRAQLRLSRAGLGRLYVKGGMLDKAIEEFNEVLQADPSRIDVSLSLIEALWQSARVDEAAEICAQVLEQHPHALKANLILGYVRMQAGSREEGEVLWRRAAACDPNNTMARAIFELAPVRVVQEFLAYDAAALPDFDERSWLAQREAAAAAPPLAEEPPVLEEETLLPGVEALPLEEEEAAAVAEAPPSPLEEPAGVSWLDSLATGEGVVSEEELIAGVAPFSLEEELGLSEEEEIDLSALEEAELPEEPALEPTQPFSLQDLGLSDEEIATFEEAVAAAEEEAAPPIGEAGPSAEELIAGVLPFSLEEAGEEEFSFEDVEVEAFSLEGLGEEVALEEAAEPFALEEAGVEPFSLEEAGIEPLSLEEGAGPAVEEELLLGVQPFSLDELAGPAAGVGEDLLAGVQPFSLDDLGLDESGLELEIGDLKEAIEGLDAEAGGAGPAFSWQEPEMREEPAFRRELTAAEERPPAGPSLFEKMKASRPAIEPVPAEEGMEPVGIEALSVEEVTGLEVPAEEELPGVEPFSLEEMGLEAPAEELPGVEPFSLEELGLEAPEEELPAVEPFSLEALDLEAAPAEEGLPEVEPFSLEGLGLEAPEEEVPGVEPFSLEGLGLEAPTAEDVAALAAEVEELPSAEVAPDEDLVQPFTLEELGLTAEEVAGLDLSEGELAQLGLPAEAAAPVAVEEAPPAEEVELALVEEVSLVEEAPLEEVAAVPSLDSLRQQVEDDPGNEVLRLELARACIQQGEFEEAFGAYKVLIKSGVAGIEDTLIDDLRTWIGEEEEQRRLHRLHRLLGDAYMKKGWYQQAVNEYAWVLSKPRE